MLNKIYAKKLLLLFCLLVLLIPTQMVYAQKYIWWNNLVNWDGVTHWSQYLNYAPGTMGVNALAVPELRNGSIGNKLVFQKYGENVRGSGDHTQSLGLHAHIPLVAGKVAIEAWGVAAEKFKVSDATRDFRKTRDFIAEGNSVGDLYIATIINLLNRKKLPQITFSYNLKTASGNNLENARFTDAPAYWFDVVAGKSWHWNSLNPNDTIRISGTAGLYVWQMISDTQNQNDAFLYGICLQANKNKWLFETSLAGYSGYLTHDKPLWLRVGIQHHFKNWFAGMRYTKSFSDFQFQGTRLQIGILIPQKRHL